MRSLHVPPEPSVRILPGRPRRPSIRGGRPPLRRPWPCPAVVAVAATMAAIPATAQQDAAANGGARARPR